MDQKLDKFAIANDMRQSLDQLAEAKGTLRCGLIWHMNNLLDALNSAMQEDDRTHEQKVKEVWKLAQEQSKSLPPEGGGGPRSGSDEVIHADT